MKMLIAIITAILICVCFIGCAGIVSEVPIDTRYTAAYSAMEMDHVYKYDWYHGDFVLVPTYKQVDHAEKYEVQYKITYSDGSTKNVWREVDKVTYEEVEKTILKGAYDEQREKD